MQVDELKTLLKVESDADLARLLQRGPSAVSNWRANKEVPSRIILKAQSIQDGLQGFSGNHNHINIGGHLPPELHIIHQLVSGWDEKRRKKLLKLALEMDDTE